MTTHFTSVDSGAGTSIGTRIGATIAITLVAAVIVAGCTATQQEAHYAPASDDGSTNRPNSSPWFTSRDEQADNPNAPSDTRLAAREEPRRAARGAWPSNASSDAATWSSMAFPTGDARTSVIGIERGTPREVRSGQPFDYQLVVTNLSSNAVSDVVITEDINSNFKVVKSSPEAKVAGGVAAWDLGELQPGESRVIQVNGTASGENAITSCSTVTYNSALCASIPVVSPKLRLTKTAPAEAMRCDEIAYNFEVTNAGTGTINNVKIADNLPEGLKTVEGRDAIDIAVGTLAAGQSKKFTSKVKAENAGVFENQAHATGDGMSADSSMVSVMVRQPALTVDIECPQNTLIGRDLTYTFTVKSTGDAPSNNTMLTATLPSGATFVKADANGSNAYGKTTWNLGTINAKESKTVTATIRAGTAGALPMSATVQGTCATAASDNCSVTIQGVPDIGISLKDDTGVRTVGDNHVFTYTVKNQGQVDLTNVTLSATLSTGLDFVSSTARTEAKVSGRNVSWNLGTLKPGQELTFTITAKGTAAGEMAIDTVTKSDQLQRSSDASEQVMFIDR